MREVFVDYDFDLINVVCGILVVLKYKFVMEMWKFELFKFVGFGKFC